MGLFWNAVLCISMMGFGILAVFCILAIFALGSVLNACDGRTS